MALLAGIAHDPTPVVTASTAALSNMASMSTTARLSFVAPANGRVMVRVRVTCSGGTAVPGVLLGAIEVTPTAGTVRLRQAATASAPGTIAATTHISMEAWGVVTGLTAGTTYTWDAAWGVENLVASSALRWGSAVPATVAANDAFGALNFEVWSTA